MVERETSEFDCCECGRHIVLVVGQATTPPLCASCLMTPGWFTDPGLRRMIDPDHDGRDPANDRGDP